MTTDAVLRLMKSVAAEVITPRFRALASHQVIEKRPGDLVTVADREAEALISAELQRAYPDALIVGEEAVHADRALVDRLPGVAHAFLVDPVDGTKNFVHGSPDHAVMVAELQDGMPVRGWIWQPELGKAYVAEQGAGAWCNGIRIHRTPPDRENLEVAAARVRQLGRRGPLNLTRTAWCCAVDYPRVAEGRLDGLVYGRGMPWDHAAGQIMLTEMGGVLRLGDGRAYRPIGVAQGNLVAAADEQTWQAIVDTLPKLAGIPT